MRSNSDTSSSPENPSTSRPRPLFHTSSPPPSSHAPPNPPKRIPRLCRYHPLDGRSTCCILHILPTPSSTWHHPRSCISTQRSCVTTTCTHAKPVAFTIAQARRQSSRSEILDRRSSRSHSFQSSSAIEFSAELGPDRVESCSYRSCSRACFHAHAAQFALRPRNRCPTTPRT